LRQSLGAASQFQHLKQVARRQMPKSKYLQSERVNPAPPRYPDRLSRHVPESAVDRPIPTFPGVPPTHETPRRQDKDAKLSHADPPPDTIFYQSNIEIDQQSDLMAREFQIGRQLCFMNR